MALYLYRSIHKASACVMISRDIDLNEYLVVNGIRQISNEWPLYELVRIIIRRFLLRPLKALIVLLNNEILLFFRLQKVKAINKSIHEMEIL